MKAIFVSHQPETLGKEYRLEGQVVTVGREEDNDVVVDSPRVSRYHARLEYTGSLYVLEDLGSKNGTWVNDTRLEGPASLSDGDIVRFGDLIFTFQAEEAATQTLRRTPIIPHETVTIMFADLQGHTDLFERLGSEAVYQLLNEHLSVMKGQVMRHGGRTVKTEGDGLLASFASVRQAVDCAVQIQRAVSSLRLTRGEPLPVRIGINSGEALKQDEDLIGFAVTKAERIMGQATGGQIYLSQVSRSLLGPASGLRIHSGGWHPLKGLAHKERLFEVAWQ